MGYVYLINAWPTDNYKIGISTRNLNERVSELQTGNPEELRISNFYETDNYRQMEKWLHKKYSHKKKEGEWFTMELNEILSFESVCKYIDETLNYLKKNNTLFD